MGKSKKGKADSKPAADGAVKEEKEASSAPAVSNEKAEAPAEETASAKAEVAAEEKGVESKAEADGSSAEGAALVEEAEKVAAEGSKAGGSENEEKKEEEGQGELLLPPLLRMSQCRLTNAFFPISSLSCSILLLSHIVVTLLSL